jgi:pimeloyl-ACP methyl ester carboxylesterase
LQKTNPRLSDARANFLAAHWSAPTPEGRYVLRADPRHKISNPLPYRAEEATLLWSKIACPTLWVMARDSDYAQKMEGLPDYASRLARIEKIERVWVDSAAHMVHHDQPELLAKLIEQFLAAHHHGFYDA